MKNSTRSVLSLIVIMVFAVLGAGTSGSNSGDSASTSSGTSKSPKQAKPAELEYVSEGCLELSEKFGASSKLSDLQKEELWKEYGGKAFKWNLEVTEVRSGTFGGFRVQFKCAPKSPSLIQDIVVSYDDAAKSLVMGMNKGETYEVQGVLGRSSSLLGMSADAIVK